MILFYSLHSLPVHGFIALVYHHYHHHHHRWCTGGCVGMDRTHSSEQMNLTVELQQFRPS
jgi:hypothetical protein